MQQKHKERQKIERIGETPSLTKTREEAARGRTTLGIRPKTLQAQVSEKPTPQQGQRRASYEKETMLAPSLEFRPCDLLGPDGQTRPGWELWVGNMMFGRADAKETLLAYHTRLHDPLPSGHRSVAT